MATAFRNELLTRDSKAHGVGVDQHAKPVGGSNPDSSKKEALIRKVGSTVHKLGKQKESLSYVY